MITQLQAAEAATIIRPYMTGDKKCKSYLGKEADLIFDCAIALEGSEFQKEYECAQSISSYNYHKQEGYYI